MIVKQQLKPQQSFRMNDSHFGNSDKNRSTHNYYETADQKINSKKMSVVNHTEGNIIGDTDAAKTQHDLRNASDLSTFIKHGEVTDSFRIKLNHIRDLNNNLELLEDRKFCERMEKI